MPAPLKRGDQIMLAAPARFVQPEDVVLAKETIEKAGFIAVIPSGLEARDGQFGGTDSHRAGIINQGLADPHIRAIWAMRGGYGSARILPFLNAEIFQADPTWIIGFSDITAMHGWVDYLGVGSLHAPVANTYAATDSVLARGMWDRLREPSNTPGIPVVGGNLSVLYSLLGTPYFPNPEGCWLLIEDLDEYLYHIDRMFLAFRLAGVFDRIHGLLVGTFSDLHDNTRAHGQAHDNPFGRNLKQMVAEHVPASKEVRWDVPVGHGTLNMTVVLGAALDG